MDHGDNVAWSEHTHHPECHISTITGAPEEVRYINKMNAGKSFLAISTTKFRNKDKFHVRFFPEDFFSAIVIPTLFGKRPMKMLISYQPMSHSSHHLFLPHLFLL